MKMTKKNSWKFLTNWEKWLEFQKNVIKLRKIEQKIYENCIKLIEFVEKLGKKKIFENNIYIYINRKY